MDINGYEIQAIIPAAPSDKSGRPETWYLVGVKSDTSAVCATTYDLTRNDWSQGVYVDLARAEVPGAAYRRALEIAEQKAGGATKRPNGDRVRALLAELEMLVDECRDETVADFYHDGRNSAEFAGAFDELNELLRNGAELPEEWSQK